MKQKLHKFDTEEPAYTLPYLEDALEMLEFGCYGGGVTDLVSSVLHTP